VTALSRQSSSNNVAGFHRALRLLHFGMYDEFDDAAFLGNNEAIAGCTASELL
jgi:hypothetical protein